MGDMRVRSGSLTTLDDNIHPYEDPEYEVRRILDLLLDKVTRINDQIAGIQREVGLINDKLIAPTASRHHY